MPQSVLDYVVNRRSKNESKRKSAINAAATQAKGRGKITTRVEGVDASVAAASVAAVVSLPLLLHDLLLP